MNIILWTNISLVLVTSLLLTGIILVQPPKDDSGYDTLGSGLQQMVNVAHIPNLLERITSTFFALFITFVLLTAYQAKQVHHRAHNLGGALDTVHTYVRKQGHTIDEEGDE